MYNGYQMKKEIVLPFIVAIFVVVANAYMNTKIKFAPTEEAAFKAMDYAIQSAVAVCAIGYSGYVIVKEVLSLEPVTRWSTLVIGGNFFCLSVFVWHLVWLRFLNVFGELVNVVDRIVNVLGR